MEHIAYLVITGLFLSCLLYGLWKLVKSFNQADFFMPISPSPHTEEAPDDLTCLLLRDGSSIAVRGNCVVRATKKNAQ